MKKFTRIIPVIFVGLLFIAPSFSYAQTSLTVGSPDWVTYVTQLITLLQQELAALTAEQGAGLSTDATTTSQTVHSVVQSSNMDDTYAVDVKTEVGGEGQHCLYPDLATEYNLGECDVPSVLDAGVVYFTVTGDYQKALLTYYPSDISAADLKYGLANPNASGSKVNVFGSVISPDRTVNPHWTFNSGTTYTYSILFTNSDGQTTTNTGTFTIPVYQYTR